MAARLASLLTVLTLVGALGALGALAPAGARADGDPASDTLLGLNVFYPYAPLVSHSAQVTLNAETAAAKRAGFPIKVALIGRPLDLGVIPDLFGKPQSYAKFLDQEISFQGQQLLLVVMADGYGVQGLPAAANAVVPHLRKPAGTTPTQLAQAAIPAVARLAAAAGHPIKGVPGVGAGASSGPSGRLVLIIVLAMAAIVVATGLVVLRRRAAAT